MVLGVRVVKSRQAETLVGLGSSVLPRKGVLLLFLALENSK
jgi:hypothetical protein